MTLLDVVAWERENKDQIVRWTSEADQYGDLTLTYHLNDGTIHTFRIEKKSKSINSHL